MNNPIHIVSVIVILRHDDQYLLVQRSKSDEIFAGKWQNLGGKVEVGERIEDAIRREIKEEIGVVIDNTISPRFVQSYSWEKDPKEPRRLGIIFEILLPEKINKIVLNDELDAYSWVTVEKAKKLDTIGADSPTGTIGQIIMSKE